MDRRIDERYDRQLAAGFLDEVGRLVADGLSPTAGQALGYRELAAHLDGRCGFEEAVEEAKRRTRRFARRQQRWFRRDPRIRWFPALAPDLAERVLAHCGIRMPKRAGSCDDGTVMTPPAAITLSKHHGLGNDFLIAVDPPRPLTAGDAVGWCDRRHGVGADGLIMATPVGLGGEPSTGGE